MWALSGRKWDTWLPGIWKKAEVLKNFFASLFTGRCSRHTTQVADNKDRDWENEELPILGENQVRDHLTKNKVHTSIGPDEVHPQVLKQLAMKLLSRCPSYFRSGGSLGKFPD